MMKNNKITAEFVFSDNTRYIFKDVESRESFAEWLKYINFKHDEKLNTIINAVENDKMIDFSKSFELYLEA